MKKLLAATLFLGSFGVAMAQTGGYPAAYITAHYATTNPACTVTHVRHTNPIEEHCEALWHPTLYTAGYPQPTPPLFLPLPPLNIPYSVAIPLVMPPSNALADAYQTFRKNHPDFRSPDCNHYTQFGVNACNTFVAVPGIDSAPRRSSLTASFASAFRSVLRRPRSASSGGVNASGAQAVLGPVRLCQWYRKQIDTIQDIATCPKPPTETCADVDGKANALVDAEMSQQVSFKEAWVHANDAYSNDCAKADSGGCQWKEKTKPTSATNNTPVFDGYQCVPYRVTKCSDYTTQAKCERSDYCQWDDHESQCVG